MDTEQNTIKPERKKPGPKPRKPMGDVSTKTRSRVSNGKKMDIDHYQEKYGKTHKLLLPLDVGGVIDRWIDDGAEVVKRETKRSNTEFDTFRGLDENPYVRFYGGNMDGKDVYHYLLIITHELYQEIKIDPERKRQAEIRTAMGLNGGEGMTMEARKENKAGVDTYAPHNVLGGTGFNQVKS